MREPDELRIHAYVLVADPSYLRESISAYYPHVDRIVLSYDRNGTSWTGTPLPLDQCLRIIAELDVDAKCVHAPGDFARLDHAPLENDTHQRQSALDRASDGADWVVQLDTDEVLVDPDAFFAMLRRANVNGADGLEYPARWLYTRSRHGWYLEVSRRWWQRAASFPGPVAVKAGTQLRHARQADVQLFRVDLDAKNTDPWHPIDAPVHAVVDASRAILHFSWVRDPDVIRRKFGWSGHTAHMRPPIVLRRWLRRSRHPFFTALMTPLRRRDSGRYRLARIAEPLGGAPIQVDSTPPCRARSTDESQS
ncbi:hypothetical protein [Microbacterium sp. H1-D42]|uniref:hypothetical protein n=1 Tax=Microbacterium sp. H1-D42 TaxID=2925844 RepID=UPI001F53A6D2|nr:hypothetical protein [Microbacterium sp. H1-D42]UNK70146.1 hypothetical protein MNR00_13380 [Microbacterium sp. H1-D42]